MKKVSKYLVLVLSMCLLLTACGSKKEEAVSYDGNSYSGKDPWGNDITVTVKSLEDDNMDWTLTVIIGEGEDAVTLTDDYSNELVNDEFSFDVSGNAAGNDHVSYAYSGLLSLVDGKIEMTFNEGNITELTDEIPGGDKEDPDDTKSFSYQVEDLEDDEKTVTLEKD